MRKIAVLSAVCTLFGMVGLSLYAKQACHPSLIQFQELVAQAQNDWKPLERMSSKWPELSQPAMNFASHPMSESVWIVQEDNTYAVIKKNELGAFFNQPAVNTHQFWSSDSFELVGIESGKSPQEFLVSFRQKSSVPAIFIIHKARLKDPETGQLQVSDSQAFVWESGQAAERFQLVSRPNSDELWVSDGSDLGVLETTDAGFRLKKRITLSNLSLPESLRDHVEAIDQIGFVAGAEDVFLLLRTSTGRALVRASLSREEGDLQEALSFSGFVELQSMHSRLQAHPKNPNQILEIDDKEIILYQLNSETAALKQALRKSFESFLPKNYVASNLHFFWKGSVQTLMDEIKKKSVLVGEYFAALIVQCEETHKQKLVWLEI